MDQNLIHYYISQPRFDAFFNKSNQNIDAAVKLYQLNIRVSESLYPSLSVLEISLRNAIHAQLTTHFNDEYWFQHKLPIEFKSHVDKAISKLINQKKEINSSRIIAELSFGFWNKLFDRNYAHSFWKPLRLIFKKAPKSCRKRNIVSQYLYRVRNIRNRIYHYEPVILNLSQLLICQNDIHSMIGWLDLEVLEWVKQIDRFENVYNETKDFVFQNEINLVPTNFK